MKNIAFIILGIIIGASAIVLTSGKEKSPELFLENQSKYSFDETVTKLESKVEATDGWKILKTYDLQKSMEKHGYEVNKVKVFSLCNPGHSSKILLKDNERVVSSMMPCRVSVYEHSDGKVYISRMNSGEMSKQIGGLITEVMGDATDDVEKMLKDITK